MLLKADGNRLFWNYYSTEAIFVFSFSESQPIRQCTLEHDETVNAFQFYVVTISGHHKQRMSFTVNFLVCINPVVCLGIRQQDMESLFSKEMFLVINVKMVWWICPTNRHYKALINHRVYTFSNCSFGIWDNLKTIFLLPFIRTSGSKILIKDVRH